MDRSFYITTPIYYVNGRPHIGHGYTTIVADVISRYHKLMGIDSFFLTGTDEHGSSVEKAATASGVTPRKFVDEYSQYFKDSWKALRIENDYFIRTTDEKHESAFQKFVATLRDTKTPDGLTAIYEGEYKGLYCVGCEKFMTEKELDENGECPVHLKKPDVVTEKNYFFRLTAYLDQVRDLIESDEFKILPLERKKEVLGLFKQGLEDFSISREKVRWGIPLPFDTEQMAYVWVDALSNYITAIGYSADEQLFDKWWNKSRIVHLIGKDILKFHAIYWPAMLLAAGLRSPDTLFVHGYFTIDGQKMSKSLGNVIANEDLVRDFGADGARYLLVNMFPFGTDGDIRVEDFYRRYNSDLANDFGNLVSRSVKLTRSNFNGKIPDAVEIEASEIDLEKALKIQLNKCRDAAESINPNGAAEAFMAICRELNRYFDFQKPWLLSKEKKTNRLATVLRTTLEGIRCVSIMAYPFMPDKCRQLRELLGIAPAPRSLDEAGTLHGLVEGTELRAESALFPRLEIPKTGAPSPTEAREDNLISIDEFAKAELRVAEVLEAENVPKTDRLLKLQVTTGADRRQIVAGIAQYYTPDELIGKKIIVVTNLKPARLRGIESNGMLLAAKKKDKLSLLTVDSDLPPGAKVS